MHMCYLGVVHVVSLELWIVAGVKVEGLVVGAGLGVCLGGVEVVDVGAGVNCFSLLQQFLAVGVTFHHLETDRSSVVPQLSSLFKNFALSLFWLCPTFFEQDCSK